MKTKSGMKSTGLVIAVLFFTMPFFTGCLGTTEPTGTADTIGDTNAEILESLGMNLDDAPAKNGNGEEVTEKMNPLGGTITTLNKVYEIAQVGATIAGLGPYTLSDHDDRVGSGFQVKTGFSGDEAWMDYPKKSLSADIDNDGKDNVITAVFNGKGSVDEIYLVVQQANGSFEKHYLKDSDGVAIDSFDFVDDFGDRAWLNDHFMMRDFTAGDFDGDGDMEFVISCKTGVIIFDHEFNLIGSLILSDKGGDNYPYVRVEAGDLNNDGYDDLVVVNGSMKQNDQNEPGDLHILKGSADGLGVNDTDGNIRDYAELNSEMTNSNTNLKFSSAEVVIFDADGNGYNELALAGIDSNYGGTNDVVGWNCRLHVYLRYIDPFNEISGNFQYSQRNGEGDFVADVLIGSPTSYSGWHHPRNLSIPRLVAGHFAPGDNDMVNALDLMWSINESGEWEVFDQFLYTETDTTVFRNMVYDTAVAGDVTGNGLDDLIYLTWSALPWENSIGGDGRTQNVMNSISIWGYDDDSKTYCVLDTVSCNSSNEYPTLALANVDDDSIVLEYLGHILTYSAPKILTVMASAPYFGELGEEMDISNSETSFAMSSSVGEGSAVNWGFSVGIIGGISLETPEGSTGVDIEVEIQNSFDWSWGQMYTKSTTTTYGVNAGKNQVIFAGVPMDTYVYKVLSLQEGAVIGETDNYTINIPREPQVSSVELSFYNEIVPEEFRIPEALIKHTIGDPFSYYTTEEKEAFETNATVLNQEWLFSTKTMGVSQGSSLNTISTSSDVTSTSTFDYDLGINSSIKAKAGFIVGGYSLNGHVGYGYTHEVSDGIEVSGSVGSIPNSNIWIENNFNWGLMMIPQSFGDQKYNLVSYWVEDNT